MVDFLIGLAFVAMVLIPAVVGYMRSLDGKSHEQAHDQSHDQSQGHSRDESYDR